MQRAFVVQLSPAWVPGRPLNGRVEHVRSGQTMHFQDVDDLVGFLLSSFDVEREMERQEEEEQKLSCC